jgi:hypothetical protein
MGGGTYFQILGALEIAVMLSVLCAVGFATRRSKPRMLISLLIVSMSLCLGVYASSRTHTLKDWIYDPLMAFYHMIRFGS